MAINQDKEVLVVDDSEDNLLLMDLLLTSEGYKVNSANSGTKGLAKVYQSNPDLIILDLMMPDMCGLEVVHRLKQEDNLPNIPILLLTANSHLRPIDIKDVNAVCYKPFDVNSILQQIKSLLTVDQDSTIAALQSFA